TAAMASDERSGDPLDAAILAAHGEPLDASQRLFELPFDPGRRYAASAWRRGPTQMLAVKGAYEALTARCSAENAAQLEAFHDAQAARGARILAVARGEVAPEADHDGEPRNLQLVGLIALGDSVRPAALQAIAECRRAGIRFVMITGDHPATARAVALALGLDAKYAASGDVELQSWSDEELQAEIRSVDVFARVRPEQKLRIVRALHASGEIVAMTGDGTNDALALREADIGVAMGRGGTEIARAAADLVLLDDDVTTIVRAVADGRRIFGNLGHAFTYLIAFHAPLLVTAFVLPLAGAPILLLPIHLIWLELIVHPTSALVFENDPPPADVMHRPPRDPASGLLRRADWIRASALGAVLAVAVLLLFILAIRSGTSVDAARAMALVAMISGQIGLIFVERTAAGGYAGLRGNPAILPIVSATAISLALAIAWAPLAHALHFSAIPALAALGACAIGCASVLWLMPLRRLVRLAH
ncbi:MAG TPA: HAD-IC family P-type ATPase, partial [Candidatus Nitrosotalea sp.]|nr:HAD-IC family P-type ATPase [Candidatus Nitrosotalea sp.]